MEGQPVFSSDSSSVYLHTQRGYVVLMGPFIGMFFVVSAGLRLVSALQTSSDTIPVAIGLVVVSLVAVLMVWISLVFSRLTVRVDADGIQWHFGASTLRRSIPIRSITSVAVVRNPWWVGWGYRLGPNGWVYNVSGYDAVEVRFQKGEPVRIGSDEPLELRDAIRRAQLALAKANTMAHTRTLNPDGASTFSS